MARLVLLHSPLVTSATWRAVASELVALGHDVTVPELEPGATSLGPRAVVASFAAQIPSVEGTTLVAHSGAGPLLDLVAHELDVRDAGLVFVDAGLPPLEGTTPVMPAAYLEPLRALARDGWLPPWSTWFGSTAMEELIRDPRVRDELTGAMPPVPLSYLEASVEALPSAPPAARGYVRTSEAYEDDAREARSRGWPTVELTGTHLSLVTEPTLVANAILAVDASARARSTPSP